MDIRGLSTTNQNVQGIISSIGHDPPLLNLESLFFGHVYSDILTAFTTMLGNLPTITSLELRDSIGAAVQVLTVTPTSHLCPLLQRLHLMECAVDESCLIAFAKSRTSPADVGFSHGGHPVHLRHIKLSECKQVTAPAVRELESLSIEVEWDARGDDP